MTDRRSWLMLVLAVALASLAAMPSVAVAQTRFVFANESPYDTMDPHAAFDVGRVAVRLNLYDGLYRWLDNPPKLEPWLAESHTISPDGLTYTFKLRRGRQVPRRHRDHAPRTCVYSAERILAMKKGAAALLSHDDRAGQHQGRRRSTVAFTLAKPSAIFMAVVPEVHVVNSALLKKNEKDGDWGATWLTSNDAGSGSYMLSRYDPAVGFIAKRFPGHFMPWGPKYIDEIEFRLVKEDNTRVLGMIKGDYQGTGGYLPNDQVKRLREAPNVKILEQESMRIMIFQINNQRRAAQRRARAPRHQLRVRLRRVQQGHPGRLGRAQPGADPQQPVGRAARREGLQLQPREGQAGAEPGRGQGRSPDHGRLPAGVQPDRAGGHRDGQRPAQDRRRDQDDERAVAGDGRADEEARDLARHGRVLDQHLLRGSQQLDRRDVPLRPVGDVQGLQLLQEPEGGRAAGRGAQVHRPQGARQGLPGRRPHRGRGRRGRVDLQHQVLRALGEEPRGHPLQPHRQRPGDPLVCY